jgi:hypothetical protein
MKWMETKKVGETWEITMYPETEREVQLIRCLRHCTRMSVTLGYNKRTPWGEVLTATQEWTEKKYHVRKVTKDKPRKRGELSNYELAKMLVSASGKPKSKRKR